MNGPKSNDTGVPRRHTPEWVEKETARTQRYYGGRPNRSDDASDVFETLVPTRNQQALMGYYIAVFSLIPLFALGLGPIAIWRGIRGWNAIKAQPELPGKAHAIVAITLGSITTAINWGAVILLLWNVFFSGAVKQ
jgi:uncharacterized Tic20 family protein